MERPSETTETTRSIGALAWAAMEISVSDGAVVAFHDHGGDSSSLPVILLHGLTQQQHYWNPVLERLRNVRVITMDQRGHGAASGPHTTPNSNFGMDRLADDVVTVMDASNVAQAIVVGHSWGASVALRTSTRHPDRVRSAVLIDGGIFGPRHLVGMAGSANDVREALRPPPLGMLEPTLWQAIEQGDLSPYWDSSIRDALAPTFRTDDAGRIWTKLGMERHMAVLDGLFAYDPDVDIADPRCPVWAVVCEERSSAVEQAVDERARPESPEAGADGEIRMSSAWAQAREDAIARLGPAFFLQRWYGALHDVPLQWPALVAGLIETVVERTSDPKQEVR